MLRQHDVEQNQIGLALTQELHRSISGFASSDGMAVLFEPVSQQCKQISVVLDYGDLWHPCAFKVVSEV